jgi:hypothetical protein
MLVSAHLPSYLPRLGYLDQIAKSDMFIVLDDVPFDEAAAFHRSRISSEHAEIWLTVPLVQGLGEELVLDKRIDADPAWQQSTWRALGAYRRTAHFARYLDDLRFVYTQPWRRVVDLDLYLTNLARRWFDIRTPLVCSSALELPSGDATTRLIAACRRLGADAYLAGDDGVTCVDLERIEAAGIAVVAQRFEHPTHRQHGRDLAFLDTLFHCGPASRELLVARPLRAAG